MKDDFKKIKSACILWYSKIFYKKENNFEKKLLDVGNTIIYGNLKLNNFLAFPEEGISFMQKAYENRVNFFEFKQILKNGLLFEGILKKEEENKIVCVQKEIETAQFLSFLEKNKKSTLKPIKENTTLYLTTEILNGLSSGEDTFRMTYSCKHCGLPEDESYFCWIYKQNNLYSVPLWIHNKGNMWIIHFNCARQ